MKPIKLLTTLTLLSALAFANIDKAIETMGQEIHSNLLSKKSKKIAVIDFNNLDNSVNNLGRHIAEKLAIKLFRINKDNNYTIVERGQLSKILKELKLSASGLVEPQSMKKIGKIYGVDTVISGSLTDLGNDIEIKAKALSVETGGMMGVSEAKIPKTNTVKNLYTQNLVEGQYVTVEGEKSKNTISSNHKGKTSKEVLKFKNRYFRVMIDKIKKHDDTIMLNMTIENRTDRQQIIAINRNNTQIIDKKDNIWSNMKNDISAKDGWGRIISNVNQKVIIKMTFIADSSIDGKVFNLTIDLIHLNEGKKNPLKLNFPKIKIP